MYVAIDDLRGKAKSAYKLVILASRRAIELAEGAPKLVEGEPGEKPVSLALDEILADKITYKTKE